MTLKFFQTIRQSLDPFWDQTLIFPPIILHGTKEYIKFLPPEVVLQTFQQDLCVSKVNLSNFLTLFLICNFPETKNVK